MTPTASAAPSVRASARERPVGAHQHVGLAYRRRRHRHPSRTSRGIEVLRDRPASRRRRPAAPPPCRRRPGAGTGPPPRRRGRCRRRRRACRRSGSASRRARRRPPRCRRRGRAGRAARCSSVPHCAITAEASTVGRNGPGATWRPSSSSTTTSSPSPPRRRRAPRAGGCRANPARPSPSRTVGRGSRVRLEQGTVGGQRAVCRQHATHGGRQLLVLVGDGDRHPCPLVRWPGPGAPRRPAARH